MRNCRLVLIPVLWQYQEYLRLPVPNCSSLPSTMEGGGTPFSTILTATGRGKQDLVQLLLPAFLHVVLNDAKCFWRLTLLVCNPFAFFVSNYIGFSSLKAWVQGLLLGASSRMTSYQPKGVRGFEPSDRSSRLPNFALMVGVLESKGDSLLPLMKAGRLLHLESHWLLPPLGFLYLPTFVILISSYCGWAVTRLNRLIVGYQYAT